MLTGDSVIHALKRVRSPIANYQEQQGISKLEVYSFIDLVKALFQHSYAAVITICTMLYNLLPLVNGFLIFVRFTIDKLIDILETPGHKDKALKAACFVGELTLLLILLYFIMTILLFPIIHFILVVVYKLYYASLQRK